MQHTTDDSLGVVEVVITVEDFARFEFQTVSPYAPLLASLGHIAGLWALLACVLRCFLDPERRRRGGGDTLLTRSRDVGGPDCYGGEDEDELDDEAVAPRGGIYAHLATDEEPAVATALISGRDNVAAADSDEGRE